MCCSHVSPPTKAGGSKSTFVDDYIFGGRAMGYESVENKVALITGGTEGIGFGIARAFLRAGAQIAITGRSLDKLHSAREKLDEGVLLIKADITDVGSSGLTIESVL
ncbi:MAG TPA: SDR family NAD(P)-dependent oxidoreductase, partial [Blastocatellia bacterium]